MATYTGETFYTDSTNLGDRGRLIVGDYGELGIEGGPQIVIVNKVWDPGGPAWVYWETSTPDSTGASYPDPYATGFGGCSGYRVAGEKQV